ncbi:MAG: hypothetical protein AVDCRST_MAG77-1453 [uncultured Chloroflexi bacterium]|uniref:Exo-alpha-sialidase n=1 Tax=uncultured Chloroflexota bacterium TaxID=166587 RepID=A0A6J4I1E4_9CHLR|nr:MAG: hypothetical protein AVDCRST_MAG77-1453 [uncultured Chloroflexota bacterium]
MRPPWNARSPRRPVGGAGLRASTERTRAILRATMLHLSTTDGIYRVDPQTGASERLGPVAASTEALAVAGRVIVAAVTPDYGVPMREPLLPRSHGGAVRSTDGGATWTRGQSLRALPGYARWTYPGTPYTPHVMVIVPHPAAPDVLLAGIEVGGIVRSDDGTSRWCNRRRCSACTSRAGASSGGGAHAGPRGGRGCPRTCGT